MWENACEVTKHSVYAIVRKLQVEGHTVWHTAGSAFLIGHKPFPTFLTNAHVVADEQPKVHPDLALVALRPAAVLGLRVRELIPKLDLAVLDGSLQEPPGKPVVFARKEPLPAGRAIAGFGFPIPAGPVLKGGRGHLTVERRLATGYVSSPETAARFEDASWTPDDLLHYELNMLAYPGISGGPIVDVSGNVVGVNRGSRIHGQQVAAYSYALRNQEILTYLEEKGIPYLKTDG